MKNLRDLLEPTKPQPEAASSSDETSAIQYEEEDQFEEDESPQFNFNELIQQQSILSRLKKTD